MSATFVEGLEIIVLVTVATATICPLFCWVLLLGQRNPA